jgi:iron(III) transport system ATP-binding protein
VVAIRLNAVTKRYGDVTAVREVSLEVANGEFFFLLGPSGCGKTTLLRIIAGFAHPDEGEVLFDGEPVTGLPAHRRGLAMVFQSYALWPHMTVAQNVGYGLEVRKVRGPDRRERVAGALELVRMGHLADRYPAELSGGEQQRVALARALVVQPRAVLLDEPLSNLDARLRLEMREELREIHRRTAVTMLYVTHDQKEALSMAERLALMDLGRIVQVGTPDELYQRPRSRFAAEFIGETNLFTGRVLRREEGAVVVETPLGGMRSADSVEMAPGGTVFVSFRPESVELLPPAGGPSGASVPNTFPVSVEEVTYLGEASQYLLRAGEVSLKCLALSAAGAAGGGGLLHRGEAARVRIAPESVVLLPPDA